MRRIDMLRIRTFTHPANHNKHLDFPKKTGRPKAARLQ